MPEEKLLKEERYVTGVCVLTMVMVGGDGDSGGEAWWQCCGAW